MCAIRLRFFPPAGFPNALTNPVRSFGLGPRLALVIGMPFSDNPPAIRRVAHSARNFFSSFFEKKAGKETFDIRSGSFFNVCKK